MTVIVFCGPTISRDAVTQQLDADVRPPAQRGDVLRAAVEGPDAIALIDGYFDRVPSVWHKEILWAMTQGVHVFGASSMGALRAAELAPFGMVGIGEIFDAFLRGELEDDDEVAVAHGDAESGYRLASDAMVNIRWTLRAAERQGVIAASTRLVLEAHAKALPYYQRLLWTVLNGQNAKGLARSEISVLRDWLPGGVVDQKRADAITMLRHIANIGNQRWRPKAVEFRLSETDGWITVRAEIEGAIGRRAQRALSAQLEDELRARGMLGQTLAAATMRLLAADRLREARVNLNARAVEAWIDDFRRDRELFSAASFDAWLEKAGLEGDELEAFFRREAVVRATRAELRGALGTAVEDELRSRGSLGDIQSSVASKEVTLQRRGMTAPTLQDAGLSEEELWAWFFGDRLRTAVPGSIAAYAAREGSTIDDLRNTALRDFMFERLCERSSGSPAELPKDAHGLQSERPVTANVTHR